MKYGKAILSLLIIVGVIVGGYIGATTAQTSITGATFGALFGGFIYCVIVWAVARKRAEVLPYDGPEEHKQIHTGENTEFQLDSMKIPRYW